MITLGIIGTANTRTADLARLCNHEQLLALRVTHLWGEDPAQAADLARRFGVGVVESWKDLAGRVDGVLVAQRDGRDHFTVARWFLERGIPVFVDKPLTASLAQARRLFDLAEQHRTPLGTCSALVLQKSFRAFLRSLRRLPSIRFLNSSGQADWRSPHAGVFFYGIHQVDTVLECLGLEVESVQFTTSGSHAVGLLRFSGDRFATMNFLAAPAPFHWRACGEKSVLSYTYQPDPERNLGLARAIRDLIKKGTPPASRPRMLAPLAILEALQKSRKTHRPQPVSSFP